MEPAASSSVVSVFLSIAEISVLAPAVTSTSAGFPVVNSLLVVSVGDAEANFFSLYEVKAELDSAGTTSVSCAASVFFLIVDVGSCMRFSSAALSSVDAFLLGGSPAASTAEGDKALFLLLAAMLSDITAPSTESEVTTRRGESVLSFFILSDSGSLSLVSFAALSVIATSDFLDPENGIDDPLPSKRAAALSRASSVASFGFFFGFVATVVGTSGVKLLFLFLFTATFSFFFFFLFFSASEGELDESELEEALLEDGELGGRILSAAAAAAGDVTAATAATTVSLFAFCDFGVPSSSGTGVVRFLSTVPVEA
mmetsp:Transcript_6793/g.13250  ORF Transcript_6793/g.13250 Transcript_6793/m.13250 type:complete len:313 (-) Transcript_6793:1261-2199(-)